METDNNVNLSNDHECKGGNGGNDGGNNGRSCGVGRGGAASFCARIPFFLRRLFGC